jgi:hypothetical protein
MYSVVDRITRLTITQHDTLAAAIIAEQRHRRAVRLATQSPAKTAISGLSEASDSEIQLACRIASKALRVPYDTLIVRYAATENVFSVERHASTSLHRERRA